MSKKEIINALTGESQLVDITAEEQAEIEQSKITHQEEEVAKENEKTAYQNLKASAKAKLIAGEALTEEEANTIVL